MAATPSKIIAPSTTTVVHGSQASAVFGLTAALTDVATVELSLSGGGAPNGIDYSLYSYAVYASNNGSGPALSSGLVSSLQGGKILTLGVGSQSFKVTANTTSIATSVTENLTFVARQTSNDDGGLYDSYYVAGNVNVTPAVTSTSKIVAAPAVPVQHGVDAVQTFNIVTTVGTSLGADATVDLSLSGFGAPNGGMDYAITSVKAFGSGANYPGGFVNVPGVNGIYPLLKGTTSFQVTAHTSASTHTNETLVFIARQTSANDGDLVDSYYVASNVAVTAPLVASTEIKAASTPHVTHGNDASQVFNFVDSTNHTTVTPLGAQATVNIGLTGWGAANGGMDYTLFSVTPYVGPVAGSALIGVNGVYTFAAGTTSFTVTAKMTPGSANTAETLVFTAGQTSSNDGGLVNSYYVASNVIVDAIAVATTHIVAGATTPSPVHGDVVTQTFDILGTNNLPTGLGEQATVKLTLGGWGAANGGMDYFIDSVKAYNVGGTLLASPTSVGNVWTFAASTAKFEVVAKMTPGSANTAETLSFAASQTAYNDGGLVDSYWVQKSVEVTGGVSAAAAYTAFQIVSTTEPDVMHGGQVVADFNLNLAQSSGNAALGLTGPATVNVGLSAFGAPLDYHLDSFIAYNNVHASIGSGAIVGNQIILPVGTTSFALIASANAFNASYLLNENLVFNVGQIAPIDGGLINSWSVDNNVVLTASPANTYNLIALGVRDTVNVTSNTGQDTFAFVAGASNADSSGSTGKYDVITGFQHGVDKIDLTIAVSNVNDGGTFVGTEADLAGYWDAHTVNNVAGIWQGHTAWKWTVGSDTYIGVDMNGDNMTQLGDGSVSQDLFIKLVGVVAIDATDFM